MSYSTILYEIEDNILTITLNRPEALNAFNTPMLEELLDACDRADADDNVKAIIVTGAGRAFCAGADLSSGGKTFNSDARADRNSGINPDGGGRLTLRLYELNKPIIAAINGPAVGVGVTMTLAMDLRLASTQAKFGFVFARRGIVPEACSSYFLPRVVGISKALEWCYSGKVFPAQEAMEGGLLRSLHDPEDLLAEARAIAAEALDSETKAELRAATAQYSRQLDALRSEQQQQLTRLASRADEAAAKAAAEAAAAAEADVPDDPPPKSGPRYVLAAWGTGRLSLKTRRTSRRHSSGLPLGTRQRPPPRRSRPRSPSPRGRRRCATCSCSSWTLTAR